MYNTICLPAFLASTLSVSKIVESILLTDSDDLEISFVEDAITAWRQSNDVLPETQHLSIRKVCDEMNTQRVSMILKMNTNQGSLLFKKNNQIIGCKHILHQPWEHSLTIRHSNHQRLVIKIHKCRCDKMKMTDRHRELNNLINTKH